MTVSAVRVSGRCQSRQPWRVQAARMAARLTASGVVSDPLWRRAFSAVPRHLLVPGTEVMRCSGALPSWWLDAMYADDPQNDEREGAGQAFVSPQPGPAALAWLLGVLIPAGGSALVRVLEIGAGCGYVTALLCERVGAQQVTATDPLGTGYVAGVLAGLGWYPTLVTAREPADVAARGPFDGILCATTDLGLTQTQMQARVRGWAGELAPGGLAVFAVRDPRGRDAAIVCERFPNGTWTRPRTLTAPSHTERSAVTTSNGV